jgi:hypothetical protein
MTALDVLKPYQEQHPDKKFATTDNCLGVWIESDKRFVAFASLGLDSKWYYMPFDILADGKPIKRNWIPV